MSTSVTMAVRRRDPPGADPLSAWWVSRFRYAPVEWIWCRLTYRRASHLSAVTSSQAHFPEHRRWSAMLLGTVVLVPSGYIVFFSTSGGWERWLGMLLALLGMYLTAGAFSPRLLQVSRPAIAPEVAIPVVCATLAAIRLGEGRILVAIWAVSALAIALRARRRTAAEALAAADDRPE